MNHFDYRDGELYAEGVRVAEIAQSVGTPLYIYSSATLERHLTVFRDALFSQASLMSAQGEAPLIAYAAKANSNLAVLKTLGDLGSGVDTVSMGEILKSLKAGISPEKIVFSGVGKSDDELGFALKTGIYQINVESEVELLRLSLVAQSLNLVANIVIRINPGVGAGGHAKITTGGATDKFGVSAKDAMHLYAKAAATPNICPKGLACHIGSQILDLEPMRDAFAKMKSWVLELRAQGQIVERLDLGGGLGVPYFNQSEPATISDYAQVVAKAAGGLGVRYIFEPGRLIAANAGILVSRIIHVNERANAGQDSGQDFGQKFLVLDAGMNDLLRPALYDAFHDIRPVIEPISQDKTVYDVVGPICETGDTFTRNREMSPVKGGDLVAFMSAGAYGAVMGSEYNSRPLAPEVLVRDEAWAIVRPRPSYNMMLEKEAIPLWLADKT